MTNRIVTLIAGATASGKSAYAIKCAKEQDALIINADSMQVYKDLCIISARPSPEEEAQAPHFLFGHIDANERYSVGRWLDDVAQIIEEHDNNIILVGGTGLYFKAFLEGLSLVPEVPKTIEDKLTAQWDKEGEDVLIEKLTQVDPHILERIDILDKHRAIRALGVYEVAGKPMSEFMSEKQSPLAMEFDQINKHVVHWSREKLYERINLRFDLMMGQGALEEVISLHERGLDESLPAMRAIGVGALIDYHKGSISLEAAIEDSKQKSRNYAKRQLTWVRNQMADWQKIEGANL